MGGVIRYGVHVYSTLKCSWIGVLCTLIEGAEWSGGRPRGKVRGRQDVQQHTGRPGGNVDSLMPGSRSEAVQVWPVEQILDTTGGLGASLRRKY